MVYNIKILLYYYVIVFFFLIGYAQSNFNFYSKLLNKLSVLNNDTNSTKENDTKIYFQEISKLVQFQIRSTLNNDSLKSSLSDRCRRNLEYIYSNHSINLTSYFVKKIILDSSKNKNDVSTYQECMRKTYYYFNDTDPPFFEPTFVIMYIFNEDETKLNSSDYNGNWYTLGLCVPKVCNGEEYKVFFFHLEKDLANLLSFKELDSLTVYLLDKNDESIKITGYDTVPLIIFIITCLFAVVILFDFFPFSLFKCCFKNKTRNSTNRLSDEKQESIVKSVHGKYNKSLFKKFKACFSLNENGEELFNSSITSSKINNYSGLTYVKGLRGMSMIFVVFGFMFFDLFNSPVMIFGEYSFIEFMANVWYIAYLFGMRIAPRILFSCSGYYLYYKFMCFLDDCIEDTQTKKAEEEERKTRLSPNYKKKDIEVEEAYHEREKEDVKWSYLLKFFLYQTHKIVIFFVTLLGFRYIMYKFVANVKSQSPMWKMYYTVSIEQISFWQLLFVMTTIPSFDLTNELIQENSSLNCFWIVYNEFFFFIVGVFIVFIGYRYKARIDRFLIMIIPVLLIFKIVFFFISSSWLLPNLYYYYSNYGKYMTTPYFNIIYFLIGMYFSSLNYVVQKGINYEEAINQDKPFLLLSVRNVNFFKAKSKLVIYILCGIGIFFTLIFIFFQKLYFIFDYLVYCKIEKEKYQRGESMKLPDWNRYIFSLKTLHLQTFLSNQLIGFLMVIDIDVIVFLFHWISFGFYIKGNNFINDFFGNSLWLSIDKCYFSFIIVTNIVIYYILAQCETRMNFNMYNIFLYGIISAFIILVLSFVYYVFYELPMKRFIKFLYNKNESEDDSSLFNSYIVNNQMGIKPEDLVAEDEEEEDDDDDEDLVFKKNI